MIDKYAQASNWESSVQVKKNPKQYLKPPADHLGILWKFFKKRQIYILQMMLGHVLQQKKHENQPDVLSCTCPFFRCFPPSTKVIETSHSLDLLVDLEEHHAPGAPGNHQPRDVGIALG